MYPTVEHAYQAEKARLMGMPGLADHIAALPTDDMPAVKQAGGRAGIIKWINRAPPEATAASIDAMIRERHARAFAGGEEDMLMDALLAAKFGAGTDMAALLLATGRRALGEKRGRGASPWTIDAHGAPGKLGLLLMAQRRRLRVAGGIGRGYDEGNDAMPDDEPRRREAIIYE